MTYSFGRRSEACLENVDPRLVKILRRAIAITPYDFTLIYGYRSPEEQDRLYEQGRTIPGDIVTWVRGGHSRHNSSPSEAVDFANYPVDYKQTWHFGFIAGLLFALAREEGFEVEFLPQKGDFGHIQLKR